MRAFAVLLLVAGPALAQEALPDVAVVGAAPLAATGTSRDQVPGATEVLRRDDIVRTGPPSLTRSLDERVGNVTLDDATGNRFQPNLIYRGFEASPLAGNPQGLAVYLNGTRFNQPFGDTVNFDLIPDLAIDRVELVGANPVFGLNALGGALSIKLKNGFTYHGGQLSLSGGSFGNIRADGQYGVQAGNVAGYVAATALNEDGWRDHSPSQLRTVFADLGWRGDTSEVHLGFAGAVNNLTGNGSTPVQLLEVSRSAVFTTPDQTRNKYARFMVNGTHELSDNVTLQGSAYYANLAQRTYNGDAADVEPCDDNRRFLCVNDGPALTTRGGDRIPNFLVPGLFPGVSAFRRGGPYAQLNETATDSNAFGASLQVDYSTDVWGRKNKLLVGASFDGGNTEFSARSSIGTLSTDRAYVAPGIVIDQADGSVTPVRVGANNRYYGVYASDLFEVTPKLALTVSGRLNHAQIDLDDQNGAVLSGNHNFTRFNPAAGATYAILPSVTAYAGYAEANRTPTPAELSCASPSSPCSLTNFFVNDPSLRQVVARTVEAGFRGRFTAGGVATTWHAGVFRTESDDDILFTGSVITGRGYFQNVGRTRRQGVEAGFTVRRGPVSAFVDYGLTDATFRTGFVETSTDNPGAGPDGQTQVRPGNRIAGIPVHRLKFGVQWEVTPAWTVGTTGVFSSGRFLQGDDANLNPTTGSYVVMNLDTTYRVTERFEVFGLVRNLLNAKYATFGGFSPVELVPISATTRATDTRSLVPGAPVAGYGGVRVSF